MPAGQSKINDNVIDPFHVTTVFLQPPKTPVSCGFGHIYWRNPSDAVRWYRKKPMGSAERNDWTKMKILFNQHQAGGIVKLILCLVGNIE